ncbi:nucleotidyltransferase domain-containing protein [Streptomyces sp. NBC_00335]|uniref:nucleotidyltransferase domain-containing protein n=1 Tax=unclassified Streptomyces TaxID=2593676 RepID=UPI00225A23F4|nr:MULTISPECIES: nucleotidyltransferase domain-containing protein [unclassified Streptomyces]MCX5406609.1 nucleotidyltransferase domain-containing protein [Streptomyces sp. NBC_00086]
MTSPLTSDTHPLPVSVAFSGPDNTGKTKQIGILARRMGSAATSAGPLDHYDRRWAAIKADGMGRWWFETGPVQEVADILASSYLERSRHPFSAPVRFLDRGIPMLEATVAATVAVRENLPAPQAADRARSLLAPYETDLRAAEDSERSLLLLHCEDVEEGTRRSLSHEATVTDVYATYQRHLHEQITRLVKDGRFGETIHISDRPTVTIQDEVRRLLSPLHPAIPGRAMADVHVAALGGMSESGKSTAGEYLRTHHGHARLKIGYLIENAASRAGIAEPYRLGPVVQAELIVDALDRYCEAHHFLDSVSIESLHDFDSTAELARMLGPQLTITYLDTSPAVRAQRGTAGAQDVLDRDLVKSARGGDKIASIAQEVIGNDGGRLELERRLDRMALTRQWPEHQPSTMPVNALGLPVHLESYLSELLDRLTGPHPLIDLLAVTGSGARGKYQHGWSDLDVFVVADADSLEGMRTVLADLGDELGGVKLGLTVLTRAECWAGAVTSRLLHVLALIGSGGLIPLWCAPGLVLPAPDAASDIDASLRDGIQAAIEIRRQLLKGTPDLRDLYKVTALLAKIQLRFSGIECPSDSDALCLLVEAGHQDTSAVAAARTERAAAEELALAVLRGWLATLPGEAA